MIKLHVAWWGLLALGAALHLIAVFVMRGQFLRGKLRRAMMRIKRRAARGSDIGPFYASDFEGECR